VVNPESPSKPQTRRPLRYLPLAVLVVVALTAWRMGLLHLLAPSELHQRSVQLRAAADARPVLAITTFVLGYAVLTGACLPVALALSLLGGLVFGRVAGAAGVLLGATGAAMVTYGATRSAFAAALVARAERDPRLRRIMNGFGRQAFSYILTLRLLPFFPFALVNIAAGLAAVPLRAYVSATLLGGVPTAVIYSSLGASLGETLQSEESLLKVLSSPSVVLPLAALAALSLGPILYRRLRDRRL
jgi:uncharacterized membrane protein YdjX (TVP38/TMEM64 family)